MKPYYKDSPLWDYLYRKACISYTTEIVIPDPEIKHQWIKNKVQEDYDWLTNQEPIVQKLLESYETNRLNKEL